MRPLLPLLLLLTLTTSAALPPQARPTERGRPAFLFEMDNPTFSSYELRRFLTTVDREAARLLGRKMEGKPVEVSVASSPIARPRFAKGPRGNMTAVFPKDVVAALANPEVVRRMVRLNLLARLGLAPSKPGDAKIQWAVIALERKLRRSKCIPPLPMAASFVGVHALMLQGVEMKAAPVAAGPPPPDEDVYFQELHAELCEVLAETVVTAKDGQNAMRELLKGLHRPDQGGDAAWDALAIRLMDALDSGVAPDSVVATDSARAAKIAAANRFMDALGKGTLPAPGVLTPVAEELRPPPSAVDSSRTERKAAPRPRPNPAGWLDERFNHQAFILSVNSYLPADIPYCVARWNPLLKRLESQAEAPAPTGLGELNAFYMYCPYFLKPPVAALSNAMRKFQSGGDAADFLAALAEAKTAFAAALDKQRALEAYLDEQTAKRVPLGWRLERYLGVFEKDQRLSRELCPELSDYLDSQAKP